MTTLPSGDKPLFDYRRIWVKTIVGMSVVALVPLVVMALFNLYQYQEAMTAESVFPVMRQVSDTQRTVESFLSERKAALDFIVRDNDFGALSDQGRLRVLFERLRDAFGGFVDLGVIDDRGLQMTYVGPYDLGGKDYSGQEWFRHVQDRGLYVSEVFRGYRDVPHLVIAAKHDRAGGGFYIVRATVDAALLTSRISPPGIHPRNDVFIINHEGILQTGSTHHGRVLERFSMPVPPPRGAAAVNRVRGPDGKPMLLGHVYIKDTPFILVVTRQHRELLSGWWKLRSTLLSFLALSALVIVIVVAMIVTFLVEGAYEADLRRTITLHSMEHTNKMASVGRLAAGVAHEINNPLAIIGEKSGLIRDLLTLTGEEPPREKLLGHVDSIQRSIERCSRITHRLLGFAKHLDVEFGPIGLQEVIEEVLGLMGKEADYREIRVTLESEGEIPEIMSDRGQLQQIFLNILNNAFDAVKDGGSIAIALAPYRGRRVRVTITDDGCGISQDNIKRIFEPFFTTKKQKGTGLGLSITYGLVQKLGGEVRVASEEGKGTEFTILLPVQSPTRAEAEARGSG
jgi:signal transduction histidine kinase